MVEAVGEGGGAMTDTATTTAIAIKDAPTVANFLSVISEAALNPSIDPAKMMALLDVQERMMNKQAELDFNAAFFQLQDDLPRITKDASIKHKDKATGKDNIIAQYASYEHIDSVIRPLLAKHGFAIRFNSKQIGNNITVFGTISHRGGHSVTDEIPLTIDSSGAKNNVQGVGSTIAYGKRYLVGMLLNLVFEGEDDDGDGGGFIPITPEQAEEISNLLKETKSDVAAFLKWLGADTVEKVNINDYDKAISTLKRKAAK